MTDLTTIPMWRLVIRAVWGYAARRCKPKQARVSPEEIRTAFNDLHKNDLYNSVELERARRVQAEGLRALQHANAEQRRNYYPYSPLNNSFGTATEKTREDLLAMAKACPHPKFVFIPRDMSNGRPARAHCPACGTIVYFTTRDWLEAQRSSDPDRIARAKLREAEEAYNASQSKS